MTLILTIANSRGVYQSSDYQLIDLNTGAPVSDRAGSKQLEAGFEGLHLQLAFTGIAAIGRGSSAQRTIDWLSAELTALPHDSKLQDICDALSKRATAAMKPHGQHGVLTLILAVAVIAGTVSCGGDLKRALGPAAPSGEELFRHCNSHDRETISSHFRIPRLCSST